MENNHPKWLFDESKQIGVDYTDNVQTMLLPLNTTSNMKVCDFRKGDPPDAIIASVTLHHLPDCWKQIALCRLFDFLKPGGKLFLADVVFDFAPQDYEEQIKSRLKRIEDIAGKSMADETVIHIRDVSSALGIGLVKGMLERAGFNREKSLEIMTHTHAYICSKQ